MFTVAPDVRYKAAKSGGAYDRVKRRRPDGSCELQIEHSADLARHPPTNRSPMALQIDWYERAYALDNEFEYFAKCSEAYFDWYVGSHSSPCSHSRHWNRDDAAL